jgi:Pectate lyase superfamily protein
MMGEKGFCLAAILWFALSPAFADSPTPTFGDGITDATSPIQHLLDAAEKRGGEVRLPPGQYLLKGSLNVPVGVALVGSWDEPHHGDAYQIGSTLIVTGGRGQETGTPTIELNENSAIKGFTMVWPQQTPADIVAYPWAICGDGMHATVEDVTFVNAYQGIKMGAPDGSLHLIRNVFGCVLRRGILIDYCSDIGRIENVHINPHYWFRSGHPSMGQDKTNAQKISDFMTSNLEAFTFARSDWEYVTNTFVWGAKSGYLFIKSEKGSCNGQFLGIGADFCKVCVRIQKIQREGLQITNGEFTAFAGDPNSAIVTAPGADGAAQFVNCNFWGVQGHAAWLTGEVAVTFSDCHFCDDLTGGVILAENGRLIVHGCTFDFACPAVVLKPEVTAAVIAENLQPGGVEINNGIGSRAVVGLNQAP